MAGPELSEPQTRSVNAAGGRRVPDIPRWVGVAALAVVLLGTAGWVISQQFTSSTAPRHHPRPVLAPTSTYKTFKDPAGAFAGGYPSNWTQQATINPQIVLLAQGPGGASYEVAKTTLTARITAANLGAATKLTERVVRSGNHVRLLRPAEQVPLGGLPGFLYLYTFVDPSTGQLGAHAHYFLFDGKTMITLVFQSLPSGNFVRLAPLFDRIASTFRVLPRH